MARVGRLALTLARAAVLAAPVLGGAGLAAAPARAEAPARVVSMNLCTDQLAMMVAAPGQLHSVSILAADPRASAMAGEARGHVLNRGLAEEIYLMEPDLVIVGSFSGRATIDMLERLGIPVAVFEPAYGLDAVRDRLRQMGEALGREAAAEALIADYDARLAALRVAVEARPDAALYYANGYTSGNRTLAGQILLAAGFENAAEEAGFSSGGFLPLEVLAMLSPDALITARPGPGASRSDAILDHPVVQALREGRARGSFTDRDWVCGTPHVLGAIEGLGALRAAVAEE
ncbi:MAG: ABC transporter substrate-binding protein [Roseicyclus sp.]